MRLRLENILTGSTTDITDVTNAPDTAEIAGYSITPRTFVQRDFLLENLREAVNSHESSVKEEVNKFQGWLDSFGSYKEFQERNGPKGPNKADDLISELNTKITLLNRYLEELAKFDQFLGEDDSLPLYYKDTYENQNSKKVTRFGINIALLDEEQNTALAKIHTKIEKKEIGSTKSSKGSRNSKDDQDNLPMLHPLEVLIIRKAIANLESSEQRTVLVDIFARQDDGSIKMQGGKLETHTVVLYLNKTESKATASSEQAPEVGPSQEATSPETTKSEIVIIDPTKSEYSKHLATAANIARLFRQNEEQTSIIAPKSLQIYIPIAANIGPNQDQYRDCIDVAVKIAFGLNQYEKNISVNGLKELDAIKEVTNQQDVNTTLFFRADDMPARIRQASEDHIRQEARKLVMLYNRLIDATKKLFPPIDGSISGQEIAISNVSIEEFARPINSSQYREAIEALKLGYQHSAELLKGQIEEGVNLLLGVGGNE